jgi:hypothetical protein
MRRISIFLVLFLFITTEAQDLGSVELALPAEESLSKITLADGIVEFNISIPVIQAIEFIREDKQDSSELTEALGQTKRFIRLSIPGYFDSGLPGAPSLPMFSSLVEKNSTTTYTLNLIQLDSVIIDLDDYFSALPLWPAQPSVRKNKAILQEEFIMDLGLYSGEDWYDIPLFDFVSEGKMRGLNIGRFSFNPIQYHPGENKIKVFYNIVGELVPVNIAVDSGDEIPSEVFDRILNSIVREERKSPLKKLLKDQPMTLVILSDTLFKKTLQPFISWKRQKGYKVIEAYTSDPQVGNDRESIKSYLSDLYFSPPLGYASPSFLLIVGDVEHVPVSQVGGEITDLFYTTYDGPGDYLPEIIHGRISIKNESELISVRDKILEYERYLFPDPDFLNKSILIAGNDGSYASTYGNGQINYASNYYFNEAHGINANVFLHPEAASLDLQIRSAIAEGAALVNYTGHGEESGWIDPAFKNNHIISLDNRSKYPLLIGNGCRTNVFTRSSGDCFAEAIVKAENKGAIAYIGCTNDSYWKEDFYWSVGIGPETANPLYESSTHGLYDKIFHDGDEAIIDWAPSLGEMIFAGNMTVQQSSSLHKEYYWMIYQLMGDPTLVPWFAIPENPAVAFPASLPPEAGVVNIEALPYDYAAISIGGVLVDAMHTDELGMASLSIPEENRGDTILLVVTGDHRQPFIRQIPDIGYFELLDIEIINESILDDSLLSNGEQAAFNITLTNLATSPSEECDLVFSISGDGITIIDSLSTLPVVNSGDTIVLESVFLFQVQDDVRDQTQNMLTFVRDADITSNFLMHSLQVHAPQLSIKSYAISDAPLGNGNGMLEAGEMVNLSFEVVNTGSYVSDSLVIQFGSSDTLFKEKQILKGSPVGVGETFVYSADIDIPEYEDQVDFFLVPIYVGDGNYVLDSLVMVIGKYVEDFSTDSISILPWIEMAWNRDTSEYYYGPASLRSAEIESRQSTSIKIKVHVFEEDSISFNYKISSEPGYDHLKFFVDKEEVIRWSGEFGWESFSHPLGNGLHDIEWMYDKDINTNGGEDAAWIDNIVFPKHSFIPDLYIDSIYIKRIGAFLENEILKIDIMNIGLDTINDFSVRYRINNDTWNEASFEESLLFGKKTLIAMPGAINLSEVRDHFMQVVIRADEDIWSWNDTLTTIIDHYEYPDLSISYIDHDTLNRDYVNLNAMIENHGNISIDGFYYDVVIDEEFSFRGKSTISLEPGESAETSLNLINVYHDWLETGWHDYRVGLAPDSAVENNYVDGIIYWIETSLELETLKEIRLYPNPASEILYFEATEDILFPCKLSITDVLGREVLVRSLNSEREQISLAGYLISDGVYNVIIQNGSGEISYRGKFIFLK